MVSNQRAVNQFLVEESDAFRKKCAIMLTSTWEPGSSRKGAKCLQMKELKLMLLALLCVCFPHRSAQAALHTKLVKDLRLNDGTYAVYTVLEGVPKWRLLPYLWVDKAVSLRWNRGKVLIAILPQISKQACFLLSVGHDRICNAESRALLAYHYLW